MKRLIILSIISFCLFSQTALKAQFKLQLIKVTCIDSEDSGGDETYIMVDNMKVWDYNQRHAGDIGAGDLKSGNVRTLSHLSPIQFNCPISIRIYDGGERRNDDLCGRHIINISPVDYRALGTEKSLELQMVDEDCRYSLTYKVLLDI